MAASGGLFPFTLFLPSNPQNPCRRSRARHVPLATTGGATTQSPYWASVESDIESYLKAAIPIRPPESVFEPMHRLTFAAPGSTAPGLCVATCELVFGGQRTQAMAAAAAMHLAHAATYAHQHLPVMDREPAAKPSIQHEFNPNIELLMGDAILPLGFELLSKSMVQYKYDNQDQIRRSIIEIARVCGSEGLIHGLYQEYEHGHELGQNSLKIVEQVCRKKEGVFHACGAVCGAILGGGAEDDIEKLRTIGLYIGTAQGMRTRNDCHPEVEDRAEYYKELAIEELKNSFGAGKMAELIVSIVDRSFVINYVINY